MKLSIVEQLDQSFSNLNLGNSDQTVIIGGDFNLAGVDWENNTVLQNCAHKPAANSLITSMITHSLSQLQREPTRGDNVLDLFITNKPSITKSCVSVPGISDHSAVVAETVINLPYNRRPARTIRQYKRANWEKHQVRH